MANGEGETDSMGITTMCIFYHLSWWRAINRVVILLVTEVRPSWYYPFGSGVDLFWW